MGRRKQTRPNRSGGLFGRIDAKNYGNVDGKLENADQSELAETNDKDVNVNSVKPYFIEIAQSDWNSDEHFDIAEVVLNDIRFSEGFSDYKFIENCHLESNVSLRFRLSNVEEGCFKLGHWPVTSVDNIFLELVSSESHQSVVILTGKFDGSDEGVSGLAHLVSQKVMILRLASEVRVLDGVPSFRVRVEILKSAFDACGSLLENTRQPWKKSMMNVMAWLRPEVTSEEAKYGVSKLKNGEGLDKYLEEVSSLGLRKRARIDVAAFYEAIRPSKGEPMLDYACSDLLPQLRPYQRRAAYWMVQRERGVLETLSKGDRNELLSPLCVPVDFLDTNSRMFYNPFSGGISLHPESSSSYVFGGILADEMGLGKTVELLACISSHRKSSSEDIDIPNNITRDTESRISNTKRLKRERIECVCGAVSESPKYEGLWVQCDICDAWQHANCVDYSPRQKPSYSDEGPKRRGHKKYSYVKSRNKTKRKYATNITVVDGTHICAPCSELIEASNSTITTGATLIVCPAPILPQWHAEIMRHTKPGSLKTCVYEGVRNVSSSATMDLNELATADIVLTTYDVLKEDLSHDFDRHDGDRRFMRFQKRYPVVPTLLTRIIWWRVCLDEAQMVESNTTAATEMALRLRAQYRWCITGTPIQRRIDDMYGLLRFLGASPFDVQRWWVEVMRDPYERRDVGAMEFTHKFFKQIMWRSSKAHVTDELQLPSQDECMSMLTFSPIEAHFYQRQHESCGRFAIELVKRLKDDIHKRKVLNGSDASCDHFLSHNEASRLLYSLLKLRQACCHPQVGSSGLRSLQQSPMAMDEILEVLVCKAKTEGEEALRRLAVSLNGLAGIAVIEQDPPRAISMYKEALASAEENSDDFRLDPLLNLHIHHNLAELLQVTSKHSQQRHSMGGLSENPKDCNKELCREGEYDNYPVKRQQISKGSSSIIGVRNSEYYENQSKFSSDESSIGVNGDEGMEYSALSQVSSRSFGDEKLPSFTSDVSTVGVIGGEGNGYSAQSHMSSASLGDSHLRTACEIKQKYLSAFISKLTLAQQEFENSHMQVCNAFTECKAQHGTSWLEALTHIEKNKDSSRELMRKVDEAVSSYKSSRMTSRFQSISGLKYLIQSGLDSLETSRQVLLERLLEINQTMEKPRNTDIERVRYCPNCQANGEGPLCIHCELDELFQEYEVRLFRLTKGVEGEAIASAEEALDLQKKKIARNRFFGSLFHENKNSTVSSVGNNKNKRTRNAGENNSVVSTSRSPSELEVIMGVLKSYFKRKVGRESISSAAKQLLLFEAMRKEYAQARFLSIAQAQVLRAHDEIMMATSRLRLREIDDGSSSIDALSSEELITANMQLSDEKFMNSSLLSRIKGQLRYLKGLVLSNQKTQLDGSTSVAFTPQDTDNLVASSPRTTEQITCQGKAEAETCPICHEQISSQKMVFQCGHVTCCKCLVALTERAVVSCGKSQVKWIMCPTCRQHTDIGNIAYVDDKQNMTCDSRIPESFQGHDTSEISIPVQGSYGTKIEAVTRRILWIRSIDSEAKVLVFSSWNDVLDVLQHALDTNHVNYIRMKGGRKSHTAIMQFKGQKSGVERRGKTLDRQSDPKSIQVLLLLIQHGANGINLLEAQHVILVEPLLNPAAEAQAINRVHRIGQERKTFVHRFIVKDTVEESIYKLNRSKIGNSIINGNTKNQDQTVLTLKDVESLFSSVMVSGLPENVEYPPESLRHLPPAVAAAMAAERRLNGRS